MCEFTKLKNTGEFTGYERLMQTPLFASVCDE